MYVQDAKVLTYDTQGLKKTSVVGIVEAKIMRRKRMSRKLDDLNKRLVKRIKSWLKTEIKQYKATYELVDEKHIDDPYKEIHFGRKECAIGLKRMISIWEKELK